MLRRARICVSSFASHAVAAAAATQVAARRFVRVRVPAPAAPPPSATAATTSAASNHFDVDDEMLTLGLTPLLTRADSEPAAAPKTVRGDEASVYSSRSSGSDSLMKDLQALKHRRKQQQQQQPAADVRDPPQAHELPKPLRPKRQQQQQQQLPDPVLALLEQQAQQRATRMQHLIPEMEKRQRTRHILMRKWTQRDVAEVIRKSPSASANGGMAMSAAAAPLPKSDKELSTEQMRKLVLNETDPLAAKAREEVANQFLDAVRARKKEMIAERSGDDDDGDDDADIDVDAAVDVVAGMSDAELAAVVRSGAIDALSLWEGDAEFAALPNEYLRADRALSLARELSELAQPQNPTDDEAQLVADAEAGRVSEFSTSSSVTPTAAGDNNINNNDSIKQLADFERRQSYVYTEQPNAVLRYLADDLHDDKVRAALEALDRAKRAMCRDAEFQAALAHVRMLERQEVEAASPSASAAAAGDPLAVATARAKMPKHPAEMSVPFFGGPSHSRPPPRAAGTLPDPETRAERAAAGVEQRKMRKMRGRLFAAGGARGDDAAAGAKFE